MKNFNREGHVSSSPEKVLTVKTTQTPKSPDPLKILETGYAERLAATEDLRQEIRISGQLVGKFGAAIPQAEILVHANEEAVAKTLKSDETGTFTFAMELPIKRLQLYFQHAEYFSTPLTVLIPSKATSLNIGKIVLRKKNIVSGKFIDVAGSPITDGTVNYVLQSRDGNIFQGAQQAAIGKDGVFALRPYEIVGSNREFEGFVHYDLTLVANSLERQAIGFYTLQNFSENEQNQNIEIREEVSDLKQSVKVVVYDDSRLPVSGIDINIFWHGTKVATSVSKADGSSLFHLPKKEKFFVSLQAKNFEVKSESRLIEPEMDKVIYLQMRSPSYLSLRVRKSNGEMLNDFSIKVDFKGEAAMGYKTIFSSKNGECSWSSNPGQATVQAICDGYMPSSPRNISIAPHSTQSIELVAGNPISTKGSIQGKIVNAQDQPIHNATLFLRSSSLASDVGCDLDKKINKQLVTPDGEFKLLNLEAGTYQINAYSPDQSLSASLDLTLGPDEQKVAEKIALLPAASVLGSIQDSLGNPIANAAIYLRKIEGDDTSSDSDQVETSDNQGHFSIRGLAAGDYLLSGFPKLSYISEDLSCHETVHLDRGEEKQVHMTVRQKIGISGTLMRGGTPIKPTIMGSFGIWYKKLNKKLHQNEYLPPCIVNPDGSFEIFSLEPGNYLFFLSQGSFPQEAYLGNWTLEQSQTGLVIQVPFNNIYGTVKTSSGTLLKEILVKISDGKGYENILPLEKDGTFSDKNFPDGNYFVVAVNLNGLAASEEQILQVVDGEQVAECVLEVR